MKKLSKLFIICVMLMCFALPAVNAAAPLEVEVIEEVIEVKDGFNDLQQSNNLYDAISHDINPYIDAYIETILRIENYSNNSLSPRELIKILTQKAIKAALRAVDPKQGEAYTREELKMISDSESSHYYGIGAMVEQPEPWILQKTEETPIDKSRKGLLKNPDGTITSLIITDPNNRLVSATEEIPVGSKLIIEEKHPQKENYLIKTERMKKRGYLEIHEIIPGGGAEKAGLKKGDILLEINGDSTENFPPQENVNKIKGPEGTTVKLLIRRDTEEFLTEVERFKINLSQFRVETRIYGNNAYLKLAGFTDDVPWEIEKALRKFVEKNIQILVIDLRDNPGGLLDACLKVADYFTDSKKTLLRTVWKDTTDVHISSSHPIFKGKIVVLVDKDSASASEILSGILQRQNIAKIAGEKSHGKGTIQTRMGILAPNDAINEIKFTTGEYEIFDPLQKAYIKVDGIGIAPDISLDPNLTIEEILENPEIKAYFDQ